MANAIRIITPYWYRGTWVFDDPAVGLIREPFVAGVPEVIDSLVASIPNARRGFRLLFSDSPFPGYHAEFERTRTEYNGTWYRETAANREGWLCPALFKYFESAPPKLFARAEAIGTAG